MRFGRRRIPELRLLALNPVQGETREFRTLSAEIAIGSAEENQFVIRRPSVSRRHATLACRKDHYELSDAASTNGTFLNGVRLSASAAVTPGDEIRFGDARFAVVKAIGAGAIPVGKRSRRTVEAVVIAFALGFGAAQYLAWLYYHAQNRLIIAEAVPVPPVSHVSAAASRAASTAQPTHTSAPQVALRPTPAAKSIGTGAAAGPAMARAEVPKRRRAPKLEAPPDLGGEGSVLDIGKLRAIAAAEDKEMAGGAALARLITNSGKSAGRRAPDLSLPDLYGNQVSLQSMRGKVVLLNFWATWCGACRREMPSLQALYREFGSRPDFRLLAISIDRETSSGVGRFMTHNGYDFPVLLDRDHEASGAYGVSGIPSTFVIGRNGRIVWNCAGALDWSNPSLRDALRQLL